MATLGQFARRIRSIGQGVEKNADNLVKQTALVADQVVVLSTPVDTGRARSNWIASIGLPATEEREPYAPGEKLGRGEGANAQAAIAQAQAEILTRRMGQDIYISNNLPYIGRLDEGSSAQAPANFVAKAIQAAISAVRRTKLVR